MSQPALYDLSYYRGRTDLASVQWFDSSNAAVGSGPPCAHSATAAISSGEL